MELALMLVVAVPVLFVPVGEFMRVSAFDQVLAEATHLAARAAAAEADNADPGRCREAIVEAFGEARLWRLLDQDDDGTLAIGFPDFQVSGDEVEVRVQTMDLFDHAPWQRPGCGEAGSLIRLRSEITVRPWSPMFGFWDGVPRRAESLVRNQAPAELSP
ncbi:MAG: hypothetical protein OXH75_17925 [Acidobacteria bacterium]|nr:hypothetical protein [Acidobacteriota bacterium]